MPKLAIISLLEHGSRVWRHKAYKQEHHSPITEHARGVEGGVTSTGSFRCLIGWNGMKIFEHINNYL